MAYNGLEEKLEKEKIKCNSLSKKIATYALAGAMLFNLVSPIYAEMKDKKAKNETIQTVQKEDYSDKTKTSPNYNPAKIIGKTAEKASKSIWKNPYFWGAVTLTVASGAGYYSYLQEEEAKKRKESSPATPEPTPKNPDPKPQDPIWVTDPNGDADSDGMPNLYEHNNGLNPLVNDANGDLDGDGYKNNVEYREGSNPNDASSHPQDDSHSLSVHGMSVSYKPVKSSNLETTLSINPANPKKVYFMMPLSKGIIFTGSKSITNPDYDFKFNIAF